MKLSSIILLCLPTLCWATPQPRAIAIPGSNDGVSKPSIAVRIYDDDTPIPGSPINVRRSAAANGDGGGVTIIATGKDGKETTLPGPVSVQYGDFDDDGWVSGLSLFLPGKVDMAATYRVILHPVGNTPALQFNAGSGPENVRGPLTLPAGKFSADDIEFLERSAVLKPSLEIGGGADGAWLSLRWSDGRFIAGSGDFGRWFANLEADLSPSDEASDSLITGRIAGDFEGLWRVLNTRDQWIDVTTFAGLSTNFESSQDFDNWNANLGLASWWFIQGDPVQTFGNILRISSDDHDSHPIALKLSADYVFAYERGTGIADPDDLQVSARLMWLGRIYTDARLPFLDAPFDVNLLVDIGTTWEPDSSNLHPQTKLSLEFEPQAYKDSKLAFALTWAQGEFSPTFVDEDALLAGLKLRF